MKLQLTILLLIIISFGVIVFITQRDSFSNIKSFVNEPTISLPPETFDPIPTPTPLPPEYQEFLELQEFTQQLGQDPNASRSAVIQTSKGNITIVFDFQSAPFAVANFYKKANSGFYNGLTFHRVEDWVIQGGDPLGDGTGGGTTPTELNNKPFVTGAVGYAASDTMQVDQGERISSGSQFFIIKQDAEHLNGQYSNFAVVTEGMDVVNEIEIGDTIQNISIQ